jgi:hypothetical protein
MMSAVDSICFLLATVWAPASGLALADLFDAVFALVFIGGVEIEELALAPQRANPLLHFGDVREFVAPVHVHAEDVHAGARQFYGAGLAESAARAQNQGPRLFAGMAGHVTCLTSISLSSPPVARR